MVANEKAPVGLVARWLDAEKATGRPWSKVLDDLNAACDTKYRHPWLSQVRTRPSQNLPLPVRQYMMRKVLPVVLAHAGVELTARRIENLVESLT